MPARTISSRPRRAAARTSSSLPDFMDDSFLVVRVVAVPVSGATVVAPPVLVCAQDRVTGSSGGARRGQGRPLGWKLKAPDPEEPAAWRSYPPPRGQTLPGSVGQPCSRSLPTEDVPPFHGGASKPAHAGASAAPPMLSALGPSQEPSPEEEPVARTPLPPAPADWR